MGIDLCLMCGEAVDFLFGQFGQKVNTIEGGLLSHMDFFLCDWYDGNVDWTIN